MFSFIFKVSCSQHVAMRKRFQADFAPSTCQSRLSPAMAMACGATESPEPRSGAVSSSVALPSETHEIH